MLPFDLDVITPPESFGLVTLTVPDMAPVVQDFDPNVEKLAFALPAAGDNTVFLHDLLDGQGVQVEVGGRVLVTLMGCVAADVPDGCLTFEIKT